MTRERSRLQSLDLRRHLRDPRFLKFLEGEMPSPMYQHWKEFGLSGPERGVDLFTALEGYLPKGHLDVVDLGSGIGGISVAAALLGHTVVGMELNSASLDVARALAVSYGVEPSFREGDATATKLPDSSYDLVIMFDLVEHVPNPQDLLSEASRLLKPGGLAFIAAPHRWSLHGFFRDPHYGLFGVSVLPKSLAAFYVVRIRRRVEHYETETLPTLSDLRQWAKNAGLLPRVITGQYLERLLEKSGTGHRIELQIVRWMRRLGVPLSALSYLVSHQEILAWKGPPSTSSG